MLVPTSPAFPVTQSREVLVTTSPKPVTELLLAWRAGDPGALDRLVPLVYDELRRLAESYMSGERPDHTLQATALVNEAYIRLVDANVDWRDRAHFFGIAARLMRRVLVDHARRRGRVKRSGLNVSLDESVMMTPEREAEIVAVDEALDAFARRDERASRVVELHYFGGLTYDEIAEALEISPATVDRDLRLAKAWLYRELRDDDEG